MPTTPETIGEADVSILNIVFNSIDRHAVPYDCKFKLKKLSVSSLCRV